MSTTTIYSADIRSLRPVSITPTPSTESVAAMMASAASAFRKVSESVSSLQPDYRPHAAALVCLGLSFLAFGVYGMVAQGAVIKKEGDTSDPATEEVEQAEFGDSGDSG